MSIERLKELAETALRWEDDAAWDAKLNELGLDDSDFEHLTTVGADVGSFVAGMMLMAAHAPED